MRPAALNRVGQGCSGVACAKLKMKACNRLQELPMAQS